MSPELTALALAGILQCAQVLLYAVPANLQVGLKYSLSPRDEARRLEGLAGRAQRAMNNHFENLILFTLAVLVVTASGAQSGFTAGCAWVYLGARMLYIPAYVLGWVPWRSMFFATGWFATLAMLVAALVA
ncbi:MAPEG family protein [Algiphilus sp.]|uniref:MAPEG family protein n=1 Tax=Algiphilus sp. TaxID=1872431 RepID=UPI003B51B324